jgi:hypothetical protein
MHKTKRNLTRLVVALAALGGGSAVHAQSADALIDKLVQKGILSAKEANELRAESDKDFTQAYQVKTGMPDWVTSLRINGDFRGRYDGTYNPQVDPGYAAGTPGTPIDDRHRFRYRLRVGAIATIRDNFEVGFRLTSSEAQGTFGGDPISGNTSFADNGSKKFIYIDQAYARWNALNTPTLTGSLTIGKMENPFVLSEMIFDPDYTPEGVAVNLGYNLTDAHALKLNLGGFMLDELSNDANDPFLIGQQLRWDAAWTPKIQTSLGGALLSIVNAKQGLVSGNVPDVNAGNSRTGGALNHTFTTFVADASATYTLDSFPMYKGAFPIKVGGEYAENLVTAERNKAYSLGVTFGKSGKKGLWDLSYKYKEMQGDFWYEEMVDSDFGAFYQTQSPFTSGLTAPAVIPGYKAGTNLRGHVIKAQYSPFDSLTFAATVFLANVIDTAGVGTVPASYDSGVTRVQVDAIFKF